MVCVHSMVFVHSMVCVHSMVFVHSPGSVNGIRTWWVGLSNTPSQLRQHHQQRHTERLGMYFLFDWLLSCNINNLLPGLYLYSLNTVRKLLPGTVMRRLNFEDVLCVKPSRLRGSGRMFQTWKTWRLLKLSSAKMLTTRTPWVTHPGALTLMKMSLCTCESNIQDSYKHEHEFGRLE